ncbi:MAG: Stp1/IreP family PP2C-type Ser/Thr phosphatase [Deltaproteobacteria bacterium]|nr:Stp1/IreP family PP2C-type Ser/Thr phosphatase [Deltaproteobacteria bacterium]
MSLKLASYGLTDVGRKRTHNEDSILVNDDLSLYIVADGMGGHSGGEFASRMAVTTMEEVVKNINSDPEATVISGVNTEDADAGDRLRYAIETASGKIYDQSLYDQSLKGMGTTTVAAVFSEGQLYIANVGDSRAYLFHANKIKQITTDHSLVTEQIRAGILNENDARKHKLKNIITRSVGYQEQVECDVKKFDLHLGDKLLLCTDGLSNMVDDREIERIVVGHPMKEACKKLIDSANEKGGEDNITVLIVEVLDIT